MSSKKTKTHSFLSSPHFRSICEEYVRRFQVNGKISSADFYDEVVAKKIPEMKYSTWSSFATELKKGAKQELALTAPAVQKVMVPKHLKPALSTHKGIAMALDIGYAALRAIQSDPSIMPLKDRAQFLFTAMNAQNNRINALAALRKDSREQVKFQKEFTRAAYADCGEDEVDEDVEIPGEDASQDDLDEEKKSFSSPESSSEEINDDDEDEDEEEHIS